MPCDRIHVSEAPRIQKARGNLHYPAGVRPKRSEHVPPRSTPDLPKRAHHALPAQYVSLPSLCASRIDTRPGDDPAVLPVGRQRSRGASAAKFSVGGAFPLVRAPPVLSEFIHTQLRGGPTERPTRVDLRQLPLVTTRTSSP